MNNGSSRCISTFTSGEYELVQVGEFTVFLLGLLLLRSIFIFLIRDEMRLRHLLDRRGHEARGIEPEETHSYDLYFSLILIILIMRVSAALYLPTLPITCHLTYTYLSVFLE